MEFLYKVLCTCFSLIPNKENIPTWQPRNDQSLLEPALFSSQTNFSLMFAIRVDIAFTSFNLVKKSMNMQGWIIIQKAQKVVKILKKPVIFWSDNFSTDTIERRKGKIVWVCCRLSRKTFLNKLQRFQMI